MRTILSFVAVIGFTLAAAPTVHARQPNIVFLFADDLGYGDLRCYGHPYARTPNLDQLAHDGTRFEQFHVTGVTCNPSRTGFMTSKWPASYRLYPADHGFGDQVTVTELLKKQGYRTGHFGKWHIGPDTDPGTYAIDVVGAGKESDAHSDPRGRDASIYDEAIEFIKQNKDQPFYMNVWGHISHFPVNPPQEYVDKFNGKNGDAVKVKDSDFSDYGQQKFAEVRKAGFDVDECMRKYLAEVASLDDSVGRLLKTLDDLGLHENTIVVFSSDHGPAPISTAGSAKKDDRAKKKANPNRSADMRYNMLGYAGGLRGGKHTMYEGGVRVPFIVRWTGHVPAGRVDSTSVISGIDWLPTLCAIVGAPVDTTKFDGEDTSAAWLGSEFQRTKPLLWKVSKNRSDLAILDGQWKLYSKYPYGAKGDVELYNLSADPAERRNVAGDNPKVVKRLVSQVDTWNDTLPAKYVKSTDKQD
ncbi:MAG TPA: sulfatase-like hydrolase/transferase [Pirellulales bacterium]|nr:sulfatase-like hydrolase/transferase [Pirellulales bacterium]